MFAAKRSARLRDDAGILRPVYLSPPRDFFWQSKRQSGSDSELRLRFLDHVTRLRRLGLSTELALKDRRRVGGDQLEILDRKFGIKPVARRFVNLVAAKGAVKFVFVIVVRAKFSCGSIRREFFFFVQHYELSRVPGLAWLADVAPKFEVRFKITPSDVVIPRLLGGDALGHGRACVLVDRGFCLTSGEQNHCRRGESFKCVSQSEHRHLARPTSTQLCSRRNRRFLFASICRVRSFKALN